MIEFTKGSIFDSKADVLVNPVNCVGVMGKGLALEFKRRFKMMYEIYAEYCYNGKLRLGSPQIVYDSPTQKYILLFPTKHGWKENSHESFIEDGLITFVHRLQSDLIGFGSYFKDKSFAFPKLGCGLGGLNWDEVSCLMYNYLNPLPNKIYVHT